MTEKEPTRPLRIDRAPNAPDPRGTGMGAEGNAGEDDVTAQLAGNGTTVDSGALTPTGDEDSLPGNKDDETAGS